MIMPVYKRIDESELFRFAQDALMAAGATPESAALIAQNLTQAELHGMGSHGVSRLLRIYTQRLAVGGINPAPQIRIVSQDRGSAVMDGDGGAGAVVGQYAMDLAIELAREHGSGWVAARNSNHYGAGFLFARQALPHGMLGYTTTSAVALVPPFGGREPALGTNPLCIAVPGGERGDVILDMATTVVARGKVLLAALEGKPIPEGWCIDKEGHPTTDAQAGAEGFMLPLGGYKGYGLALIVEILSALLSGAAMSTEIGPLYGDLQAPQRMGHFFGALDVSAFLPLEAFRARMDALIDLVKAVRPAEGVERILVPGEPERLKAAQYRNEGIPIAEDVLAGLDELAAELGVPPLVPRV
jgi:LDH2 family malate/lactate/ureidoglycolate dehydrogenase